jgi:hypothetical protein
MRAPVAAPVLARQMVLGAPPLARALLLRVAPLHPAVVPLPDA